MKKETKNEERQRTWCGCLVVHFFLRIFTKHEISEIKKNKQSKLSWLYNYFRAQTFMFSFFWFIVLYLIYTLTHTSGLTCILMFGICVRTSNLALTLLYRKSISLKSSIILRSCLYCIMSILCKWSFVSIYRLSISFSLFGSFRILGIRASKLKWNLFDKHNFDHSGQIVNLFLFMALDYSDTGYRYLF